MGGILNLVLNTLLLITKTFTPTTVITTTLISNLVVIAMEYRLVKKEIKLDIQLFAFENLKYLYYSLIFIPITFAINKFVPGVLLSCVLDIIMCCSIYLTILMVTKDKIFFELLLLVLEKIRIIYNKLKVI
jgi:hypothetical protein